MFGIGVPEMIIIAVIFMIVFGAGKFPDAIGQLGKGLRSFKKEVADDGERKTITDE